MSHVVLRRLTPEDFRHFDGVGGGRPFRCQTGGRKAPRCERAAVYLVRLPSGKTRVKCVECAKISASESG